MLVQTRPPVPILAGSLSPEDDPVASFNIRPRRETKRLGSAKKQLYILASHFQAIFVRSSRAESSV